MLKLISLLAAALPAAAVAAPLWLRMPAISPDGTTIAFSYKGDIYTVAARGGEARQITTNAAYDAYPVWSHDARHLAFASAREGSLDVYIINKEGGTPKRLTTASVSERPVCFRDTATVLFTAAIRPTAESNIFAESFPQVYAVSTKGGRPTMYSTLPLSDISINAAGEVLYHDMKGYEDPFRKHHTSPIARDIWLMKDGRHTCLTDFAGEDRTPVWAADGQHFWYTSEQDGTFNVYYRSVSGTEKPVQITRHKGNPVRSLSVARDGLACYSYDGEIYTVRKGEAPRRVEIAISTDEQTPALVRRTQRGGATNISVAPSGKEIAFVMHGDVYVTSADYETTRRITDTPEQERTVAFSPDGRSLVYDSERGGLWQIYTATITSKDEKLFSYATDIREERLTDNGAVSMQPKYSPDGKSVAFFKNRGELCAIDVKSRQERTLMPKAAVYSYSDGDLWFEWSPDSRWLLAPYMINGGWNNADVALVPADGSGRITDLTESGYSEGSAQWALGGKAMLFESDRAGFRSHGSWGAESDLYLMFFDQDAYEKYLLTKEEKELLADAEKEKKPAAKKPEETKKTKKGKAAEPKKEKPMPPVALDTLDCRNRIVRLTPNSSSLGAAVLSVTGDTLYYQTRFEGGYDLWRLDRREHKTERVAKSIGGPMCVDKARKNIFALDGGGIKKIDFRSAQVKPVTFAADFNYRPSQEREYVFDHVWRQVKEKFYKEDLHGVDWEGYRATYRRFLPYISNNYDFADLLSEMLGELNASHTGARYRAPGASLQTASLGLFYDEAYEGDGLRIREVMPGSPLALKQKGVVRGSIIEAIDGHKIVAGEDYFPLLDGKAGKRIHLAIRKPGAKAAEDIITKPISMGDEQELLYRRWVERNRRIVDSLSHGQLAYVHVRAMDSKSFRTVYRELLAAGNRCRKAVIVDERHNGGGWLHDDLCTLLSGKEYQQFVPRGQYAGSDPFNKWRKPSCVLICEDDYSNGHGFPWVYKTLGIGKLIGAPMAGTMTAVWWENQVDPSLVFGIPQVGCRSMQGVYGENTTLSPDITVYNTPEDYAAGCDRQLERAVEEMMK